MGREKKCRNVRSCGNLLERLVAPVNPGPVWVEASARDASVLLLGWSIVAGDEKTYKDVLVQRKAGAKTCKDILCSESLQGCRFGDIETSACSVPD